MRREKITQNGKEIGRTRLIIVFHGVFNHLTMTKNIATV